MSGIVGAILNGEAVNFSQLPRNETVENLRADLQQVLTKQLLSGKTITFPRYLDGGAGVHKKYFLEAIGDKKYTNAYEWCAGHGEIGFELITGNICQTLAFSDCYDKSTDWCLKNARALGIEDKITTFTSSIIGNAPFTNKFDLVIGNPPNSAGLNIPHIRDYFNPSASEDDNFIHYQRINTDLDFAAHREFFDSLYKYVTNNADIFITVNIFNESYFKNLAMMTGFTIVRIIDMMPDDPHLKVFHFKPL